MCEREEGTKSGDGGDVHTYVADFDSEEWHQRVGARFNDADVLRGNEEDH